MNAPRTASGPQAGSPPMIILVVAFAAIWILAHPYRGIRDDGELYLGQALLHLNPEVFSKDLFFAYGSQDRFTLFSRIYAWAIEYFGIGPGTVTLLLGAQLSFACLTAVLLRRLYDGMLFWLGLALLFSYFPFYGPWVIFSYGESFLTARSVAEPLCLLALIMLIDGRTKASAALIIAAGLLHPLIAIATACFWWVYLALRDPRWWLLAIAGVAVPILGAFDLPPLQLVWHRYDSPWWQVVTTRDVFVLPTRWAMADWMNVAVDSAIVSFAVHLASDRSRRFLLAALVAGLVGVAAAMVGADLMRNVLLTSLQLWRTHWILHLVAVGMLPFVIHGLSRGPGTRRVTAALLVTAFVSTRYPGSAGAMLLALGIHIGAGRGFKVSGFCERVLLFVCALATVAAVGAQLNLWIVGSPEPLGSGLFGNDLRPSPQLTSWGTAARAISYPLVTVLIVWGLLRALRLRWSLPFAAFCAVSLGVLAIGAWDQRSPWSKYMEARPIKDQPFAGFIPPGRQVLWYGELLATWVVLSRPSWYSSSQGPGVLFNRGTALEYDRRRSIVDVLEGQEKTCMMIRGLFGNSHQCSPDFGAVQAACRDAGNLDFIVTQSDLQGLATAEWTFAAPGPHREVRFYLYDCKRLVGG